jgi:chemotaxis protein CheC
MIEIQLTPLQHDAITELLNIGMGQAAASLSEMVGEEVKLSVPSVELLLRHIAAEQIELYSKSQVAAIKQHFNGPFWGDAFLLFDEDKSLELVKILIKEDLPIEILKELERDALLEIGNIILNSCLASLANVLAHELHSELPVFLLGSADEILKGNKSNEIVMFLRMDFSLKTKEIDGYVAFVLEIPSIERFIRSVDVYLGVLTKDQSAC